MPKYDKELVSYDAELKHSTERAWLFVIDGEEVWVPMSIGEWEPTTKDGVVGVIEVPTWFAAKNDLA